MENVTSIPIAEVAQSSELSTAKEEKQQTEALLAEARNTKDMLQHFKGAVISGTFEGGCMMSLAKGLAFVEAILNQNKAHIQNLQERLKGGK